MRVNRQVQAKRMKLIAKMKVRAIIKEMKALTNHQQLNAGRAPTPGLFFWPVLKLLPNTQAPASKNLKPNAISIRFISPRADAMLTSGQKQSECIHDPQAHPPLQHQNHLPRAEAR
jgi:hypothetical protein